MSTFKKQVALYFQQHSTKSFTRGVLQKEMEIQEGQHDDFLQAIKELDKEGLLHAPKKGKIQPLRSHLWVIGKLSLNPKGYGFVVDKEKKQAIFIPKDEIGEALHEDCVLVLITKEQPNMKHPEGRIASILERSVQSLVGTYHASEDFGYVIADDPRFKRDIYIPDGESLTAQHEDKVVVVITEYPKRDRKPEGRITEVLGHKSEKEAQLLSILKDKNISYEFPLDVLRQTETMPTEISEHERQGRKDLTQVVIFTIDGEDAKDLDDAISIEKLDNGHYRLGVHIADVAHYVKEHSPIDKEALHRGTSVYLIDTVIPMLPQKLSNHLCSLHPNEDKLTLSVIMEINAQGVVVKQSFVESIIHSKARLTYKEVTAYINGDNPAFLEKYPFLEQPMAWLHELTMMLNKRRIERGSIEFEFDESKIILGEKGEVLDIELYERGIANDMIEESMLVCNETVAEFFSRKHVPFVYRVHANPKDDQLTAFEEFIEPLGFTLPDEEDIHKGLQAIMEGVKGTPQERATHLLLLRSMMQARYSSESNPHFGLATSFYSHFTSPIRRYPDLQIHRIIKEYLHHQLTPDRKEALETIVDESSRLASRKERNAEQAEKEYKNWKKLEWAKSHIGEHFEGIITTVNESALEITLHNTVEGVFLKHKAKKEGFVCEEGALSWVGEKSGRQVSLGDLVQVVLEEVSDEQQEILFNIVFA